MIVALILLLGTAYSVYMVFRPLSLVIISERFILELDKAPSSVGMYPGYCLTPDGRYLLFSKREAVQAGTDNASEQAARWPPMWLLDVTTGEQFKPPFQDVETLLPGWPGPFTADGHYIYGIERYPVGPDGRQTAFQENDRPWLLLYDIHNRVWRTIKIGPALSAFSDDSGKNLLVSTGTEIVVVPVAGGEPERYPMNGEVCGVCRRTRALILNLSLGSTYGENSTLSVMDLPRGMTMRTCTICAGFGRSTLPTRYGPFALQTRDGRFVSYMDLGERKNYAGTARNFLARFIPLIGRSAGPEVQDIFVYRTWDSVKDRVLTMEDAVPLAPGPSPSSLLVLAHSTIEGKEELRVLDLATGREYTLPRYSNHHLIYGYGKHLVLAEARSNGGTSLLLVEIALPETAR